MRAFCTLAFVAACGGGGGDSLVASASFVVTEKSGAATTSRLDVLLNQTITFEIAFDGNIEVLGPVGGCPTSEWMQPAASTTATGASAEDLERVVFAYLPDWYIRLSLCDVHAQSSVQLSADDFMGTMFTLGCIGLPASAVRRDGSGNPEWSSFTAPSCTFLMLDSAFNRVIGANDVTMTITVD